MYSCLLSGLEVFLKNTGLLPATFENPFPKKKHIHLRFQLFRGYCAVTGTNDYAVS